MYAKIKALPKTHSRYLTLLLTIVLIKAAWACFEISSGYISLNPDEAQYWTWSKRLAFGFYSKPPGIALQIWLGCKFLGQSELGIRSGAILITMLSTLAAYWTAFKAHLSPRVCFWSATVFALSPVGMMGTFAATTDGGLILFWTLALAPILYSLETETPPNYFLVSLFILCGALYKWPIYALWAVIIPFCMFYRPLYHKSIFSGMTLSLAGLLPSLVWNSTHNWATFRHVLSQTTSTSAKSNFFDFLGAQFGILSPIFFVLLLLGILEIIKRRQVVARSLVFCTWATALILGVFLWLSSIKKVQANWALYAYPTATPIIAWYAVDVIKKGHTWLMRGVMLSLTMVFIMVSIPVIQKRDWLSAKILPYKINPFRHSMGWQNLKQALNNLDYDPKTNFLFSDNYQMTSILSFYGPEAKNQYFFNTQNRRQNQFCFWPTMADEKVGKTGYYVCSKNSKDFTKDIDYELKRVSESLSPYFKEVKLVESVPLFISHNTLVKGALIFKCSEYNGKTPQEKFTF